MKHSVKEQWALRQAALIAFAASFGIRADARDPVVAQYRARQEDLINDSQVIIDKADAEKRELSTEEKRQIADNAAEVDRLESEVELRTRVSAQQARLTEPQDRQTPANAGDRPQADDGAGDDAPEPARPAARQHLQTQGLTQPAQRLAARGNGGFRSLFDFSMAVKNAAQGRGLDQRLANASLSTYGTEGIGTDGGFAVPPDYRNEIMALVTGEESLLSRCDASPTASNSVTVPTDETTAWGTSGVRVYSRAEAAAMSQSKPSLRDVSVRLNEIYALVPLTDELIEDAPLLSRLIATKAAEAMNFKVTDYIINGTGAGQPLGILNSPALVTVSKESSQTAATVHAKNVAKMWARMPAAARARAVWICNQDVESALMELGFQVGSPTGTMTGGMPLFVPPGGLSASPYSTLLGKPIITTEACAALGTVGDIILAYLPGYFLPYKAGGIKGDMSMHLWFDQATTAFRWTFRFGGQPWLSAPIARKNGSNTLSHFVALETR